jgi:hypothetical protein
MHMSPRNLWNIFRIQVADSLKFATGARRRPAPPATTIADATPSPLLQIDTSRVRPREGSRAEP